MKKIVCLILFAGLLLCTSCGAAPAEGQTWAYDTLCTVRVWGGRDPIAVFAAAAAEGQRLLSPDGTKQFTASVDGEELKISADLARILNQSGILYEKTNGVFDLTVAPLSELWDVNRATVPPLEEEILDTLSRVGFDRLTLTGDSVVFSRAGTGVDIGSVGKGYGADYAVTALKSAGADAGVVSFGGNVAVFGTRNGSPFRIGIRDPKGGASDYLGILSVTDCSVVTSGAYERYFEYTGTVYHHLLDAKTGYPRQSDLLSVTVLCADGAQADMMATALWLMGEKEGFALYEALQNTEGFLPSEAIFVCADGRVIVSDGVADRFSLTSDQYRLE